MENSSKRFTGIQFDIEVPADAYAYINEEDISLDDIRQVIEEALLKLKMPQSDAQNFFRSNKKDLGIMCKFHCNGNEKLEVELIWSFRLSAKELNFSYKGKKVRIFHTIDDLDTRPSKEKGTSKHKFVPSDGFATVLSYLDELTDNERDEDLILEDIIMLCLGHYMRGDVLQLEIIAAPLAVFNVD
ncbi:hypothetical protein [Selenomonas sp. KH1T6]|uniref:hypothetical protein n=1 Tax=Selenomonas sp. KH1T6 TaxID=3158784 RepID=UPI0008A7E964|nr:hypothetical protein SAMN05216583_15110 [Selenomonas ruminantium]